MTFEESFVEYCSPTLAGIKIANLYRYFPDNSQEFVQQFDQWRQQFSRRGLKLKILKKCRKTNSYLLYLYREDLLRQRLLQPDTYRFLAALGYNVQASYQDILLQLSRRVCLEQNFPHEIGVFLGYPLQDVIGFIQNKGKDYICRGYWKSYGDPQAAQKRFSSYRTCTKIYKQRYTNGTPISQLIVAA